MDAKRFAARSDASLRGRWPVAARFLKNRRGSVAIEFTALAIPFSLLIFAILESCISFAGQQLLANATDDVARQIRTGQLKPGEIYEGEEFNAEMLFDKICTPLEIIVADGCPGLHVDLQNFTSFELAAELELPLVETAGGYVIDENAMKFEPGLSMSKNTLRTFYAWPVMTDFMRKSMSNLADDKTLHFATVTWQNEPFDDN